MFPDPGAPAPRRIFLLVALLALLQVADAARLATWCAVSGAAGADADFPCAGHDCGCLTAEDCRTDCCCFPVTRPAARSCCSAEAGEDDAGALAVAPRPCRSGDGHTAPAGHAPFVRPAPLRHAAHVVFLYDVPAPAVPVDGTDPAPPGKVPIAARA